ncbi:MAG: TdeIII family type II restriction endonuclease [Nostocaceae cyanobacterium]|nr:TdeIII family type II restriction endonuclease [Nostocaceae cyanobacterium]
MDKNIKNQIKESLKKTIRKYFHSIKSKRNYQVLDLIFPVERRIRSLIGGLETSLGTTFWEPVAKILAQHNGFQIITDKILCPQPFPQIIQNELNQLINERETKPNGKIILTEECIGRLKAAALKINSQEIIAYKAPPSGTGVDIHLLKDGIEYVFDIKTPQPNLGDFKRFNKQLLEWYAYKFVKYPNAHFEARISIPFNPFERSWYTHQRNKLSNCPLDVDRDIWVGDEFWDFCSGMTNTSKYLENIFKEIGEENFSQEFSDIFYGK